MAPGSDPHDTPLPNRRNHQARHRQMVRSVSVDIDCLIDLIDVAEAGGDEYLTAVLRLAVDRLAQRIAA